MSVSHDVEQSQHCKRDLGKGDVHWPVICLPSYKENVRTVRLTGVVDVDSITVELNVDSNLQLIAICEDKWWKYNWYNK